jgi:AcrR family transcriptional regulator
MEQPTGRARLLDAVIEHFTVAGVGDQSLRQIAAAVGTSHRMLLYHFGSKDGLLVEVAQAVEARTRANFETVSERFGAATDEVVREMWRQVSDPKFGDFERLFFALCGKGLQGQAGIGPLLGENIEGWIRANVEMGTQVGIPDDVIAVHARLGLAVTRGLLMDLLATGDRSGVNAALEVFARTYAGKWWEGQSVKAGTSSRAS